MNLYMNLANAMKRSPEKNAYVFGRESETFRGLNDKVNQFAFRLTQEGIGKGDTVAILLGNSTAFIIAYYGILCAGATVVPVNPTFTAREISYILSDSRAKGVIAEAELGPLLKNLKHTIPFLEFTVYTRPMDQELEFSSFFNNKVNKFISPEINGDDLAVVLYTSGTTGEPKGVMLTHKNLHSNAEACLELFELTAKDRIVTVLPIFHIFCMTVCMNASILSGATMLLLPKFSPKDVIETIYSSKATVFAGVPTMYNFLLQGSAEPEKYRTLRICISGGASLPLAVINSFKDHTGIQIQEGYGLSEASPVTTFNPLRGECRPGSVGKNIPLVENKVVDSNGKEVPVGEIGELIVKGPNVMKGYLNNPELTMRTIKNGWLYTGDMAKMDNDGYFYIVDRKKDMINVGGFNVYPREIEEVLYDHPDIVEAGVIGVPDENYGESVIAYIVSKNKDLQEEDIREYLKDKLVKYKLPKDIEFLAELPKNSTGKILRRSLVQLSKTRK